MTSSRDNSRDVQADGKKRLPSWRNALSGLLKRRITGEGSGPTLQLDEWEIWHTYVTFLHVQDIDLDRTAQELVESGIALCAVLRDGRTYWSNGSVIGSGTTSVDLDTYGSHAKLSLKKDSDCRAELDGFAAEAWWQASCFRFYEKRLFGEDRPLPANYIRAFLGQINLIRTDSTESAVRLFPVLLIYESGVLVLELREISPDLPTQLDEFISGAVNLFQHPFDRVEVPPGLARVATRAYYHSYRKWTLPYRAALLLSERGHDRAVRQLTRHYDEGDFAFDLAPLSHGEEADGVEQLSTLALTVFHVVAFVVGRPRFGVRFLLLGQRQTPILGDYWSGRPHVHLIRFKGQCETASENERQHGKAFGNILLRVPTPDATAARHQLPKNARVFEDYGAYLTSAASLWVWSESGMNSEREWADVNRGHLVYGHQAIVELAEYGYILHRSLLERATKLGKLDQVFSAQRSLLTLQQEMAAASHFGEIRELLERWWEELGLHSLQQRIDTVLAVLKAEMGVVETRMASRVGRALTVVFGLLAVPRISKQVVQPLWEILAIPHPAGEAAFTTLANGVSLTFVSIGLLVLVNWVRRSGSVYRSE